MPVGNGSISDHLASSTSTTARNFAHVDDVKTDLKVLRCRKLPSGTSMPSSQTGEQEGSSMIPVVKAKLLEGKRGLIVGIANEQSIAWGCAKAFRALGAELAVTYLNDKAKKYVEPLARELEAPIMMPRDAREPGPMEAVFERIAKDWGKLDFVVPWIASAPKQPAQ